MYLGLVGLLEGIAQPVQSLVETVTRGSAGRLDELLIVHISI